MTMKQKDEFFLLPHSSIVGVSEWFHECARRKPRVTIILATESGMWGFDSQVPLVESRAGYYFVLSLFTESTSPI